MEIIKHILTISYIVASEKRTCHYSECMSRGSKVASANKIYVEMLLQTQTTQKLHNLSYL